MADKQSVNPKTPRQKECCDIFKQVTFMERFHCSYDEYMNTPVDFVDNAITIISLINEKSNTKVKKPLLTRQ